MKTALIAIGTLTAIALAAGFALLAFAFVQDVALTLGFMAALVGGGA